MQTLRIIEVIQIKNNIKEIRISQKLTLVQLAEKSELSAGYICHLERGSRRNASYDTMNKIAKALNREIGDVFEIE